MKERPRTTGAGEGEIAKNFQAYLLPANTSLSTWHTPLYCVFRCSAKVVQRRLAADLPNAQPNLSSPLRVQETVACAGVI